MSKGNGSQKSQVQSTHSSSVAHADRQSYVAGHVLGVIKQETQLLEDCRSHMKKVSKSFYLASRLFPKDLRQATYFLYSWCRYCDDQVDEARSPSEAEARLIQLKQKTGSALKGCPEAHPVFQALPVVVNRYQIPHEYFFELLEGMEMDIKGYQYESLEDLKLYCFRVAGVVGLMLSHVMGVSDRRALQHAVDLGIAMQLTNISRDIKEDYEKGRVYLPRKWLQQENVSRQELMRPEARPAVARVVQRLLAEADLYYASGRKGYRYLNFRSALTISVASLVYARIGKKVLRGGERALESRVYTTLSEKLASLVQALAGVFMSLPRRWTQPWQRAAIETPWRYR